MTKVPREVRHSHALERLEERSNPLQQRHHSRAIQPYHVEAEMQHWMVTQNTAAVQVRGNIIPIYQEVRHKQVTPTAGCLGTAFQLALM